MTRQPTNQSCPDAHSLRASRYDRASSWLLTLLITVSLSVFILLVSWFSSKASERKPPPPPPPPPIERFTLNEIVAMAGGTQLIKPSDEPPLQNDIDIQSNLDKLNDAAKKAQSFDEGSRKDGDGSGIFGTPGDKRDIGPPEDPSGKQRRWEVQFDKTSLDAYARQLDFFKIELGVLLPDGRLAYAHNLGKSKPDSRFADNPSETEKRYYLTWRKGELQEADRQLLAKAGIDAGKSITLKFLPPEVEAQLAALEKSRAAEKAGKVDRTRFGVRLEEKGFAFFVLEQTYKE